MRRMLGAIICWAIADRPDPRIKELADYAEREFVRRWEREGEIMRDAHRSIAEVSVDRRDEILELSARVLKLEIVASLVVPDTQADVDTLADIRANLRSILDELRSHNPPARAA